MVPAAIRQPERVGIALVMVWFVPPDRCAKMVIARSVKVEVAEVEEVAARVAATRQARPPVILERAARVEKALEASGVCRRAVEVAHVKWARPKPSMVWHGHVERWS